MIVIQLNNNNKMKNFAFTSFIIFFISIQAIAQKGFITSLYPDMKGNTFLAIDTQQTSIIYNIADGKIIGKYPKGDPGLPAKVLRYKLVTTESKWDGLSWKDISKDKDGYITGFKKNNELLAKVAFSNADNNSVDIQNSSNIISMIIHPNKGKQAYVYIVNIKDSTDGSLREKKLLATYTTDKSYSYCALSPKGNWIFDARNFVLIEVATGKIVKINGEFYNHVTFTADETKLMYGTANEVVIIETATGQEIEKLTVPESLIKLIKNDKLEYCARPLSDGKSFVFRALYGYATTAWLVKGEEFIELKD